MQNNTKRGIGGSVVLMAFGVLLIVGAIAWYFYYQNGQPAAESPTAAPTSGSFAGVERVSPSDAKAAYDRNQAVFVDVRSSEEFGQRHIKGALSIPLLDLPDRIAELDPDTWIITY